MVGGDVKVMIVRAIRYLAMSGCLSEREADAISFFVLSEVFSGRTLKEMAKDLRRDARGCAPADTLHYAQAVALLNEVISHDG